MASAASKSAITPSRRGLTTSILAGFLPSIFFASSPIAKIAFVFMFRATTDGCLITTPFPRTCTTTLAVPKSIPTSKVASRHSFSNMFTNIRDHNMAQSYQTSVLLNYLMPSKGKSFIQSCFYVLFFVTPLLLWPYTSEVFEFNKMMFVYAMTIVITAAWGIRSFQNKRFEIVQTPLDLPIILFLSSQVISTMVSIDRHTSLWGYYSRFHGGLVSTICYIVLFYALVTHFSGHVKAINNLKTTILATAALTAFYAVLEKMGIDKNIWVQDVQSRVFSTLGQPNWLSAYLIALLPLSLFTLIRTDKTVVRLIHSALSLLFLAAILFTRSQSGIGATAIILLIFVITVILQKKQPKLLIGLAVLILALLFVKGEAVQRTLGSLNKINPFYSNSVAI